MPPARDCRKPAPWRGWARCPKRQVACRHFADLVPLESGVRTNTGVRRPFRIDEFTPYGCRNSPGKPSARIVAVQKAQRVSELSLLEKTSTVATPIEPDIFRVLARAPDHAARA
jgi:hypothetical protein